LRIKKYNRQKFKLTKLLKISRISNIKGNKKYWFCGLSSDPGGWGEWWEVKPVS
jgi:hypothetical protein